VSRAAGRSAVFARAAARALGVALALLLALLTSCHPSRAAGTVEVVSGSGEVLPVAVELAVTPDARQLGLMYRDELAPGSGMLFIFPTAAHQSFWMKNTKIPLDILFIDDAGRIVRLHARTTPFSEASLPSDVPVRFVLEVPGGWSAAHGVKEGDTVRLGGLATYPAR
jgi:uncharacterized membrane protein (UPF0127 family)